MGKLLIYLVLSISLYTNMDSCWASDDPFLEKTRAAVDQNNSKLHAIYLKYWADQSTKEYDGHKYGNTFRFKEEIEMFYDSGKYYINTLRSDHPLKNARLQAINFDGQKVRSFNPKEKTGLSTSKYNESSRIGIPTWSSFGITLAGFPDPTVFGGITEPTMNTVLNTAEFFQVKMIPGEDKALLYGLISSKDPDLPNIILRFLVSRQSGYMPTRIETFYCVGAKDYSQIQNKAPKFPFKSYEDYLVGMFLDSKPELKSVQEIEWKQIHGLWLPVSGSYVINGNEQDEKNGVVRSVPVNQILMQVEIDSINLSADGSKYPTNEDIWENGTEIIDYDTHMYRKVGEPLSVMYEGQGHQVINEIKDPIKLQNISVDNASDKNRIMTSETAFTEPKKEGTAVSVVDDRRMKTILLYPVIALILGAIIGIALLAKKKGKKRGNRRIL